MADHDEDTNVSIPREPDNAPDQPTVYEIKVRGHLGPQWSDWFEGLTISLEDDGHTLLSGPVVDQAAMHALLRKVRDLGMPLVSVVQAETAKSVAPKKKA